MGGAAPNTEPLHANNHRLQRNQQSKAPTNGVFGIWYRPSKAAWLRPVGDRKELEVGSVQVRDIKTQRRGILGSRNPRPMDGGPPLTEIIVRAGERFSSKRCTGVNTHRGHEAASLRLWQVSTQPPRTSSGLMAG